MKLPPICAVLPLFENPDITNSKPPSIAEKIMKRPKPEVMRTGVDFDQANERKNNATASTKRIIPSTACSTSREPTFSASVKNPESEYGGGVTPLDGAKKMFTVSPDQPWMVKITKTTTKRILNFREVRLPKFEEEEDFISDCMKVS